MDNQNDLDATIEQIEVLFIQGLDTFKQQIDDLTFTQTDKISIHIYQQLPPIQYVDVEPEHKLEATLRGRYFNIISDPQLTKARLSVASAFVLLFEEEASSGLIQLPKVDRLLTLVAELTFSLRIKVGNAGRPRGRFGTSDRSPFTKLRDALCHAGWECYDCGTHYSFRCKQ